VVFQLADKLGICATKHVIEKSMNKVIEADFFPRKSDVDFYRPSPSTSSAVKEKRRILIVDNDRDSTHLVKILLERTGRYLVLEENDATKAHQSAQNFRPDLILLDIVMPETDGGEVAAQIQADPELQRTSIIFLTALVTKAETKSGLRIQGHPFIAKPISIPDLIKGIEENLPAPAASASQITGWLSAPAKIV
jgi:CheY-like chemotaxis protein